MNSSDSHSLEKAEAILREGGADTEVIARAMIEGLRSLESGQKASIAAVPKPVGQTGIIVGSAAAVLLGLALATGIIVSEIRGLSKTQAESMASSQATLLEKQSALIKDTERSGTAAANAANVASEAATRASRAADEIERNARDITRLVTIMQERATSERSK